MDNLENLLTVNRDNAPDPLELCLPLDLALDLRWSKKMSRSILAGKFWNKRPAAPGLSGLLPDTAGLYMFVWKCHFPMPLEDDADFRFRYVLYIGKAGDSAGGSTLRKRFDGEYSKIIGSYPEQIWKRDAQTRSDLLKRFLNFRDLEYWYTEIGNVEHLNSHETTLIKLFNPPGNTTFTRNKASLKGKLQSAIPAF